jgi:DMSO/TMAO reductase YedYZ molybdopterin-dependent catalytic subunit
MQKRRRFPINDALANKVFLAYQINGEPLPQKHGFPLRIVAEGHFGYAWVKYVYKISID